MISQTVSSMAHQRALTSASQMRNFKPLQVVMGGDRANSIVITSAAARSES